MRNKKMPDWKVLVRERLHLSEFTPQQQTEIIAELAAHLEDLCAEYRSQGLSESAAIECALAELGNSDRLSRNIRRARRGEETMNPRTKQLLLPGLISMAIAIVAPVLLVLIVEWFRFHTFADGPPRHVSIKFDFLFAYLLGGAASAYLCRRAGGSRLSRITVALFPVAAWFCCICVVFILNIGFLEPGHFVTGAGFAQVMDLTILQPAALLLLGAAPFLMSGHSKRQEIVS